MRCVATALVAGVISKLILFPNGILAETPMWLRLVAAGAGFAAFLAVRQMVIVGVLVGVAVLICGWLLLGGVSG